MLHTKKTSHTGCGLEGGPLKFDIHTLNDYTLAATHESCQEGMVTQSHLNVACPSIFPYQ